MSTPIVGRLGVRISPDTSRFSQDLQRQLGSLRPAIQRLGLDKELGRQLKNVSAAAKKTSRETQRSLTAGLTPRAGALSGLTRGLASAGLTGAKGLATSLTAGTTRALGGLAAVVAASGAAAGRALSGGITAGVRGLTGLASAGLSAARSFSSSLISGTRAGLSALTRVTTSAVTGALDTAITAAKRTAQVGMAAVGLAAGGALAVALSKGSTRLTALDNAEAKLKGLGRSGEEITRVMQGVNASVTGTAYGLDEAAGAAAKLVGVDVRIGQDLDAALKLTADIAAQAGTDMDDISSIMAKIYGNGKLTGETLAQLDDRAVGASAAIARHLNVSLEDLRQLLKDDAITAEIFAEAMENHLGGAAQATGDTIQGSLANAKAALGRIGATMLGPIYSNIPMVATAFTRMFDAVNKALKPHANNIGEILTPALTRLSAVIEGPLTELAGRAANALGGGLTKAAAFLTSDSTWKVVGDFIKRGQAAFATLRGWVGTLWTALSPLLTQLGPLFGALGGRVQVLGTVFQALTPHLGPLVTTVAQLAQTLGGALAGALERVGPALGTALGGIAAQLPRLLPMLGTLVGVLGDALVGALEMIAPAVGPVLGTVIDLAQSLGTTLVNTFQRVWPSLRMILGGIAGQLPRLLPMLGTLGGIIGDVVTGALEKLGPNIGPLLGVVIDLASALGRVLMPVLMRITPYIGPAVDAVIVLAERIGTGLVSAVERLEPYIGPIVDGIGDLASTIGTGLVDAVEAAAPGVGNLLDILGDELPRLGTLAGQLVEGLAPIPALLGEGYGAIGEAVGPVLSTLMDITERAVGPLTDALVALYEAAVRHVLPALGDLLAEVEPLLEPLGDLLVAALEAIAWAAPIAGKALGWLAEPVKLLIRDIVGGLVPAVETVTHLLRGEWGGAWDKAKEALSYSATPLHKRLWPEDDLTGDPDAKWGPPMDRHRPGGGYSDYGPTSTRAGATINIYNPINEPTSEIIRTNAQLLGEEW